MGFAVPRRPQPEERVMLDRAFPQVLAGPGAVQAEHEGVLLLPALRGEARGSVSAGAQGTDGGPLRARGGAGGGTPGQGLPGHRPPPPPVSVCSF